MAADSYGRTVTTVDLGEGASLKVEAIDLGGGSQLVGEGEELVASFADVAGPIESVSRKILEAVKGAAPDKTSIELTFGVAVEAGKLFAFLAKGSAEASIKVTLEWSKKMPSS